jgi:hypothetical protein
MKIIILILPFVTIGQTAQSDEINCLALNSGTSVIATFIRSTCYVYKSAMQSYTTAKTSCNDLKNGHLAFLTEDDMFDQLKAANVGFVEAKKTNFSLCYENVLASHIRWDPFLDGTHKTRWRWYVIRK